MNNLYHQAFKKNPLVRKLLRIYDIASEAIFNAPKTNYENYILQILSYVTDLKYVFSYVWF